MKKILFALFFCSLFGIYSCEEDNSLDALNSVDQTLESRSIYNVTNLVKIKDGRFVFPSVAVFEEFVNSLKDLDLDALLDNIPPSVYKSIYRRTGIMLDGEELDIPELEVILNEYGILEVDDRIYRLNFAQEVVYVLPASADNSALRQMERSDDPADFLNGIVLPLYDDIFTTVYNNSPTDTDDEPDDVAALWGCDAAPSSEAFDQASESCILDSKCVAGTGEVRAKYAKYGIWFEMFGEFRHLAGGCEKKEIDFSMNLSGSWNRCGPGGSGSISRTVTGEDDRRRVTVYSGTRRLKTYGLTVSASTDCDGRSISAGTARIGGG